CGARAIELWQRLGASKRAREQRCPRSLVWPRPRRVLCQPQRRGRGKHGLWPKHSKALRSELRSCFLQVCKEIGVTVLEEQIALLTGKNVERKFSISFWRDPSGRLSDELVKSGDQAFCVSHSIFVVPHSLADHRRPSLRINIRHIRTSPRSSYSPSRASCSP